MKRLLFLLSFVVVSTLHAADIERHWKSGCSPDNWPKQTAGIDITVYYYSMPAGTLHIRRTGGTDIITPTSITAGSGSFTIPHSVRSGYGGQCNDCTDVEWDGIPTTAFVAGQPAVAVTGGKAITQHTIGPSTNCLGGAGETTVEVNNTITYYVNGSPDRVRWVVTYTGPQIYAPGELALTAGNGSYVGAFPIPGGGTLETTHAVAGSAPWSVKLSANLELATTNLPPYLPVYFTASPISGTVGASGDEVFNISVVGSTSQATPTPSPGVTATPRATPPGPTPTPQPTLTPPPTQATPGASVTPPPNPTPRQNYPTPSGSPTQNSTDVYHAVRDALNQSGNADTNVGSGVPGGPFQYGDNPAAGGKGTGTNDALDRHKRWLIEDAARMKTQSQMLRERFGTDKKLKLPAMTGSKMSWDISFPFILGRTMSFTVNLAPYATWIGYFRNVCLLGMYIFFWAVTIKTLQKAFA